MPNESLDLRELLSVPFVDPERGFDISPDGQFAAFSWNPTGQWEIYEIDLKNGSAPKKITTGSGAKFAPRYSPDGSVLGYAFDDDGSEAYDLFTWNRSTGIHTNLTPNTAYAHLPAMCWSPDGNEIALLADSDGVFKTYIMAYPGGEMRLVLDHPKPAYEVRWSIDGTMLAVLAATGGQDFGIIILNLQSGKKRFLGGDEHPLNARGPRWLPDGKLIFTSDHQGFYDIGIHNPAIDEIQWVTHNGTDKEHPQPSPDGKGAAYISTTGVFTTICTLDLVTGESRTYEHEPGVHYAPRYTPDGKKLLFIFDNPRQPGDLWSLGLKEGNFTKLTQSLPIDLQEKRFVMPQAVSYPSSDGIPVPALLFQPQVEGGVPKNGIYVSLPPAVIIIHGGPAWLFQYTWYPIMAHLASRGWVVLAPNYRGSTGYGRWWQNANQFDIGGVDTRDVAAGADFLIREGIADPERIGVTGRSHGGYLTMTCMTRYPEKWAAGSAVVPFLNMFTAHANSREDLQYWDIQVMGDPEENQELWHDRSPYFFLDKLSAPVQMICGANDVRCPAVDSIEARDRMAALGKEIDFYLYKDEGHAFLKKENLIDSEVRRVSFLAKYLEGK